MEDMLSIRKIAIFSNGLGDNEACTTEYLNRRTADEFKEASEAYDSWYSHFLGSKLTLDELNDAHFVIMTMVSAYEQHAREAGFRDGVRVMHEALCGESPSVVNAAKAIGKHQASAPNQQKGVTQ